MGHIFVKTSILKISAFCEKLFFSLTPKTGLLWGFNKVEMKSLSWPSKVDSVPRRIFSTD